MPTLRNRLEQILQSWHFHDLWFFSFRLSIQWPWIEYGRKISSLWRVSWLSLCTSINIHTQIFCTLSSFISVLWRKLQDRKYFLNGNDVITLVVYCMCVDQNWKCNIWRQSSGVESQMNELKWRFLNVRYFDSYRQETSDAKNLVLLNGIIKCHCKLG